MLPLLVGNAITAGRHREILRRGKAMTKAAFPLLSCVATPLLRTLIKVCISVSLTLALVRRLLIRQKCLKTVLILAEETQSLEPKMDRSQPRLDPNNCMATPLPLGAHPMVPEKRPKQTCLTPLVLVTTWKLALGDVLKSKVTRPPSNVTWKKLP